MLEIDEAGELGLGAAKAGLDAAGRLVLAEAVRDHDDERFGHGPHVGIVTHGKKPAANSLPLSPRGRGWRAGAKAKASRVRGRRALDTQNPLTRTALGFPPRGPGEG